MPEHLKRLEQLRASRARRHLRKSHARHMKAMGLNRRSTSATFNRRFRALCRQGRIHITFTPQGRGYL